MFRVLVATMAYLLIIKTTVLRAYPKPIQILTVPDENVGSLDAYSSDLDPVKLEWEEQNKIATHHVIKSKQTESDSASFEDLLDSFGGLTDKADLSNTNSSSNAAEEPEEDNGGITGVYYLLDWNTFLDVDDQLGRRVNLRFQPKIGNPKRFFAINTP